MSVMGKEISYLRCNSLLTWCSEKYLNCCKKFSKHAGHYPYSRKNPLTYPARQTKNLLEITRSMKFHCSDCAFFFQNAFQTWRSLPLSQWESTDFSPLEKFNIVSMGKY